MKRHLLSLIFALVIMPVAWSQKIPVVRVGLLSMGATDRMAVSADSEFCFIEVQTGKVLASWEAGERVVVTASGGLISVGEHRLPEGYFSPAGDRLKLFGPTIGRKYRGWLHFSSRAGNLVVVNEVAIETYLMGVVPCEMSATAPLEALKAQAVAARTFALSKIGSLRGEPFDVDDTTRCQTYRGSDAEQQRTNEAIRLTSNEVLLYGGSPIQALYSTVSGGVTASAAEAFRSNGTPYLRSILDVDDLGRPYATGSRWFDWTLELGAQKLNDILSNSGIHVGDVSELAVVGRSESGRVAGLKIKGKFAEVILPGSDLRKVFGPDLLKSTLFEITASETGWTIRGRGWGHGVGMCQAGAIGRANAGQKYDQILGAYFPGTELIQVRSSPIELASRGSWVDRRKYSPR